MLDYDNDGDMDIYVTNGPGSDNSLYSNQLKETGYTTFSDAAVTAGVAARNHDSSGTCFADTDNDGDQDLLVLSAFDPNLFFENNGDGTYTDNSSASGITKDGQTSVGCSFGDVNNDGFLDVAIANNVLDWTSIAGIGPAIPFGASWHNQLFLNTGSNTFVDVSTMSGIEDLLGFPEGYAGFPSPTWAIAMVDYDLDGDIDIIHADDGGPNRGFNHLLENDGTGKFRDVILESGLHRNGHWMGLSFGDINDDGYLDFFATNIGDWNSTTFTSLDPVYLPFGTYELGDQASRWFLGGPDGVFTDPGVGELVATGFGWGTSMADYDNDADTDVLFHGGLAFIPFVSSYPGNILQNDGAGNFTYDLDALASSVDHRRRNVQGLAVGDLNDDGFTDIVSVSNIDIQDSIPITSYATKWGSAIDDLVGYQQLWTPTPTIAVWEFAGHPENKNGSLAVEVSSADNGNGWVKVRTTGSIGLTPDGNVNRDGIGAVLSFRSHHGSGTMMPVMGGSSYASQDSLEIVFGLGKAQKGDLEVSWPGGVRNRLYNVHRSERILLPEIPCSFDGDWQSKQAYKECLRTALDDLRAANVISPQEQGRLFSSAVRAFHSER